MGPNFWMKVTRNENYVRTPPNVVHFKVSPEMTRLDIKNYLEKIYKLPVVNVQTKTNSGFTRMKLPTQDDTAGLYKEDDIKLARVTFPADFVFEMPDVTKNPKKGGESQEARAKSEIEETKKQH